jgi:hypothetical protein
VGATKPVKDKQGILITDENNTRDRKNVLKY